MKIKVFLVLIAINIYLNVQTDHKYLDYFFQHWLLTIISTEMY